MTHVDAKYSFTANEFTRIKELVAQLERSPEDKQKSIRNKLREMKLYWNDFAKGIPYTVESLERFVKSGILTIIDKKDIGATTVTSEEKNEQYSYIVKPSIEIISKSKGREKSDEYYVIDLCDEALGIKASRQHKFKFLVGDAGRRLPVDAYYEDLKLVIEYYERQHTEAVKFFDMKMTASGVTRDEQRKINDARRKEILPKHGIRLIVISFSDFGKSKKLKRNHDKDLKIVKEILKDYIAK